jgi:hypothetical protein
MPATPDSPAFICVYGPSGVGKSTDQGRAFPNGLFIAAPGALESITSTWGYGVAHVPATDIEEATAIVKSNAGKFDAIVVDDFSFLAEKTFARLEKKHTGFKLWGALRDVTLDFRDAARYASMHVALSCWMQPPATKPDGTRVRGGPMLSGKLPEQLPAMCDIVLQCAQEPMRKPWPTVYRCYPSNDYVMKDRFNISTVCDPAPMNLGEILRAAGYQLSRHKSAPWQEDIVTKLAVSFIDPTKDGEIANAAYQKLIAANIPPKMARLTISDALDRAVIKRGLTLRDSTF